MKKNRGLHSIGLTRSKQKYHVLQSIVDNIYQEGYEVEHKTDKYNRRKGKGLFGIRTAFPFL